MEYLLCVVIVLTFASTKTTNRSRTIKDITVMKATMYMIKSVRRGVNNIIAWFNDEDARACSVSEFNHIYANCNSYFLMH